HPHHQAHRIVGRMLLDPRRDRFGAGQRLVGSSLTLEYSEKPCHMPPRFDFTRHYGEPARALGTTGAAFRMDPAMPHRLRMSKVTPRRRDCECATSMSCASCCVRSSASTT